MSSGYSYLHLPLRRLMVELWQRIRPTSLDSFVYFTRVEKYSLVYPLQQSLGLLPISKKSWCANKVMEQRGVALLLSLVCIAILSALVFAFMYEMEVDAYFAQNQGADFEARLAAHSAVVNGLRILADHYAEMLESGTPPVDSELDSSQWHLGAAFEPLNEATMRTSISDEFGKINVNALLLSDNGELRRNEPLINSLREFFVIRGLTDYDPVDAILDWLDYNDGDAEEPDGAENEYYAKLENPYPCKNGPMDTIEELLLIKGITPEVYFGDPEKEQEPLSEYLTVHGDWDGKVNVNTARVEVIAAIITGHTGSADLNAAQQIYDEARLAPIDNAGQLRSYIPASPVPQTTVRRASGAARSQRDVRRVQQERHTRSIEAMFRFNSNVFRIYGDGMKDDSIVRVEAYVFREPYDERDIERQMSRLGNQLEQEFQELPRQLFRVLEWKVVQ